MSGNFNNNRISIITKANLRYEGILYNINAEDQQITLTQVKSFGTEGRRLGNEIGPSPETHEYIIFKGTDIKDLKVLETAPVQEKKPEPSEKPQIEKESVKIHSTPNATKVTETLPSNIANENQVSPMKGQDPNQEFDFTAMNETFQKMTLQPQGQNNAKPAYKMNDFFDELSSSTTEKPRETIQERQHQKDVNKETFGQEFVDQGRATRNYGYRKTNQYRTYNNQRGPGNYSNYNNNNNNKNYNQNGNQNGGYGGGGYQKNYNVRPQTSGSYHHNKYDDGKGGENVVRSNMGYGNNNYGGGNNNYGGGTSGYGGGNYRNNNNYGGNKPVYNNEKKNEY